MRMGWVVAGWGGRVWEGGRLIKGSRVLQRWQATTGSQYFKSTIRAVKFCTAIIFSVSTPPPAPPAWPRVPAPRAGGGWRAGEGGGGGRTGGGGDM